MFVERGNENKVWLLHKSLYGLKQAPSQWYERFDNFVLSNGFSRSLYDNCVYFMKTDSDCFIYSLIYVDDMLIISKGINELNKLKNMLKTKFKMKDLGYTKKIFGIDIIRNREKNNFVLSQAACTKKVLEMY